MLNKSMKTAFDKKVFWNEDGFIVSLYAKLEYNQFL